MSYPVAANLHQVLRRLRDYHRWHPKDDDEPPAPLRLWIDALCINQADKIERSAQVQRMNQIYTKATRVFACVGEIEPSKEDPIEKLFSIPWEPLKRDEHREEHGDDSLNDDDDRSEQSLTGPANWFSWKELAERVEGDASELEQCMIKLCKEAFFSRIWIVQELTLGHHLEGIILYGPHSINTLLLLELHMTLRYDHADDHPTFLQICKIIANAFAMISGGYSFVKPPEMTTAELAEHLLELIRATQHFHATEPRDKIYALLGLINKDLLPAHLLPSYDEPIEKVYQAWTKFLLGNTGDFTVIEGSMVKDPTVPSWVSCLSSVTDRQPVPADPANVRFSDNGDILYVKGRLINFVLGAYSLPAVDLISHVDEPPSEEQKAFLTVQAHQMEATLIRHVRADADHGENYVPYVFDLMMRQCDRAFGEREGDMASMEQAFHVYEQIIINNDAWSTASTNVLVALQRIFSTHNWVVLRDGGVFHVNVGCNPVNPTDEVYALQGSSSLTVLRRYEAKETFQRVGYCDGGVEHEEWENLEGAVNGELGIKLGGRGTFRPRIGMIEIPIA